MNTKIRDIASLVFEKIYYLLTYSVIYVIALLMGLGFLTFAGGNILVYKLDSLLNAERYKEKIKIFKFFKENIITYTRKYIKISLLYVSLLVIIAVDIFYFSTSINAVFNALFYLMIILAFIIINSMAISFYLISQYDQITFLAIAKNSISLVVVNIIDIILLNILLVLGGFLLNKISPILLLIILPGLFINLSAYFYKKMLEKKSLTYLLFSL